MIAHRTPRRFTFEEYLEVERKADFKSEFIDGAIYAMTGGSARHARIIGNVFAALHLTLRGGACRPYTSDMQLFIEEAGLGTYPDVTVYCGPLRFWTGRTDVATNPTLVVEVLSPGSAKYDRGDKFEMYQRSPTLKQMVLISQEQPRVEVFTRTSDGSWPVKTSEGVGERAALESIGIELALADAYDGADAEPVR